MDLFSISQLQQFSGIKAHTIRIWEQRYNALTPSRSQGNTRYYSNYQLRRLLNIVSLMGFEYKISELCAMPDEMLFKIINSHLKNYSSPDLAIEYTISQLLAAGMSLDENYFDTLFSGCIVRYGIKNTYVNVVYPMLERIGLMWTNDTMPPAQEHFISNIIRQKLFTAIDSLPPAKSSKDSWLLFLPENEFHEIGLLFAQYVIRSKGKKVFYLGCNVPLDTLTKVIKEITPANILFFLVHNNIPVDTQKYLNTLSANFRKTTIYLSGSEKLISGLKPGKSTKWIRSVEELEKQL
jgi:methanogenic corrinoid protein MtbC1